MNAHTTEEETKKAGRTPSMFASLLVTGVMILLTLLSVVFFGADVAEGPLQVSMTLAALFALGVAYYYGFRGPVITQAINSGIHGVLGTIFVLLAIGTMIGTLYLTGTVASVIYYGVTIISAQFYYITVFLLALGLASLLGSSLTTVGAVGIPFISLASIMGVSPVIAAGAAIAGGIMGNKIVRISDTVNLTIATVGGVSMDEHLRSVRRTALPTILLSALLYLILGFTGDTAAAPIDPSQVQETIGQYFNISLLAFLPILLIFACSLLRFSPYLSLMLPAIFAVVLAAFTQRELITALAADPSLGYFQAVLKVSIDVLGNGFSLGSGVPELDQIFSGGGASKMLTTMWLILMAAAFGAVTEYTGMLERLITPVISWAKGPAKLILTTMLTSIGLNIVTADYNVSIVLTGKLFRQEYINTRLKPTILTTAMADSGNMFSNVIPWNVHGVLFAAMVGTSVLTWAPYAFTGYLTPVVTYLIAHLFFRNERIPEAQDATEIYGAEPTDLPQTAPLA